jgi:hypothetical protein
MPKTSSLLVALAWCVIGYWFLDRGEAILASLGSISTATWARNSTTA